MINAREYIRFDRLTILGVIILLLSSILPTLLSAQELGQKDIADAKKEGVVVWYTSLPIFHSDPISNAFREKYGIRVELVRGSGLGIVQRFYVERQGGQIKADVFSTAHPPSIIDIERQGWFGKSDNLPNWPKIDPRFKDKHDYWFSLRGFTVGYIYNRTLVKEGEIPRSWEDFLNPRWKGKMAAPDFVRTGSPSLWAVYMLKAPRYGEGYLRSLAEQKPLIYPEVGSMVDAVVRGAQPIGIAGDTFVWWNQEKRGAPLGFRDLDPALLAVDGSGVVSNSLHPNAARLFQNYLMGQEIQSMLAEEGGFYVFREGVKMKSWNLPLSRLVQIDYEALKQGEFDALLTKAGLLLGIR